MFIFHKYKFLNTWGIPLSAPFLVSAIIKFFLSHLNSCIVLLKSFWKHTAIAVIYLNVTLLSCLKSLDDFVNYNLQFGSLAIKLLVAWRANHTQCWNKYLKKKKLQIARNHLRKKMYKDFHWVLHGEMTKYSY